MLTTLRPPNEGVPCFVRTRETMNNSYSFIEFVKEAFQWEYIQSGNCIVLDKFKSAQIKTS